MVPRRGALWAVWLGLLVVFSAHAEPSFRQLRHLTPAEGLPDPQTWVVTQDGDGYIWIGSSSGLSVYDGDRFSTLTVAEGLPPGAVVAVAAADDGVWAGTEAGLARVRDRRVEQVLGTDEGLPSADVRALAVADGGLWGATGGGVFRLAEGRIEVLTADGELPSPLRLVSRADGGVWVGTERGPWRSEADRLQPVAAPAELAAAGVYGFAELDGELWVGSSAGLWRRSAVGWSRLEIDGELPAEGVRDLLANEDGLWIGTWGAGLMRWHRGERRGHPAESSFPLRRITDLFQDLEGNLWLASDRAGVALLADRDFRIFDSGQLGLPAAVARIAEGPDGEIWFAGEAEGLSRFDGMGTRRAAVPPQLGDRLSELAFDGAGRRWMAGAGGLAVSDEAGTRFVAADRLGGAVRQLLVRGGEAWVATDGGIFRVDAAGRVEPLVPGGALLTAPVAELREGVDGTLWAATGDGLVLRPATGDARRLTTVDGLPAAAVTTVLPVDDGAWVGTSGGLARVYLQGRASPAMRVEAMAVETSDSPSPEASAEAVRVLLLGAGGVLWAGTDRGVLILDGARRIAHRPGGTFAGSRVKALFEDQDGSVWVGTDLGLNRCRADSCEPFSRRRALPQQTFYEVLRTDPDRLWFVTSMGVHRFDGEGAAFYPYLEELGVRAVQPRSAFVDSRGALWIGTDRGAVLFRRPLQRTDGDLPIHLLELSLNGETMPVERLARPLPADTASLSLEYAALGYRDPRHIRYSLTLEAPEGATSFQTRERRFTLPGLRAGEHRLTLSAVDSGGRRSLRPVELPFVIAAPVWQRGWFLGIVALVTLALAGALVQWRIRSLVDTRQRLEELVRQRTAALNLAKDKLERLATLDDLTGLPNYRQFWARSRQLRAQSRRHGTPFALILADLDDFKQVNDRWGHQAGDAILQHASRLLAFEVREEDLVARYGGEEFAALLHHSTEEDALAVAERMREALDLTSCTLEDGEKVRITGSFGVATWGGEQDDLQELFRRADVAVYRAKNRGKNLVVAWNPEADEERQGRLADRRAGYSSQEPSRALRT